MANFVFDGTQDVTLTAGSGFDPATDKVSIANKVLIGATFTAAPGLSHRLGRLYRGRRHDIDLEQCLPGQSSPTDATLTSTLGTVALGNTTAASHPDREPVGRVWPGRYHHHPGRCRRHHLRR